MFLITTVALYNLLVFLPLVFYEYPQQPTYVRIRAQAENFSYEYDSEKNKEYKWKICLRPFSFYERWYVR